MANDRSRMEDLQGGPERNPRTDMNEERAPGAGDDVRGVAEEGDEEEFEDTEDLDEEDEESDGTI